MSKFFVQSEEGIGPGGQIYFRRHRGGERWYNVFLGDTKIGMIMKDPIFDCWNALSNCDDSNWFAGRSMDGFATRMAAATFIIKHHGYWLRSERDSIKTEIRADKFLMKFRMKKTLEIMKGHEQI